MKYEWKNAHALPYDTMRRITGKMILKCVIFHGGRGEKKRKKTSVFSAGEEVYKMEREKLAQTAGLRQLCE